MVDVSRSDGRLRVRFDAEEAGVLRGLVSQLRALIESSPPGDLVMGRLVPPAYEEPSDEASYRELVGDALERQKSERLEQVSFALGARGAADVSLEPDEAEEWLTVLTDLRLAIGVRLDVDEERMGAELRPEDPDAGAMAVLHWLGWVQEELLRALSS